MAVKQGLGLAKSRGEESGTLAVGEGHSGTSYWCGTLPIAENTHWLALLHWDCSWEPRKKRLFHTKKGESVYIESDIFLFTNTKFWRDSWSRNWARSSTLRSLIDMHYGCTGECHDPRGDGGINYELPRAELTGTGGEESCPARHGMGVRVGWDGGS